MKSKVEIGVFALKTNKTAKMMLFPVETGLA